MGIYDNYDPEEQKKYGLITIIFMMVICIIFVAAKVFGSITWGWGWVFFPMWGPIVLGIILMILGVKPPGQ